MTSNRDRFIAAGLGMLALAIYFATLAPGVLFADGGEFQFVPWLPGIAHPTGYPLYILLGWLFSHLLPIGEVAWRLNLFSAVTGAGAVSLVYLLTRRITELVWEGDLPPTAHRLAAAAAALSFALGQTFWSQTIIAEVYSLHALLVALLVWSVITNKYNPSAITVRDFWLPALVFGISLTHHRTTVLMIPALLVYLWLAGFRRVSVRSAVELAAIGVLPALLYLYLPLIAPHVPYANLSVSPSQSLTLYANTINGFIAHISGRVFAADVQPSAVGINRLMLSLNFMRGQIGWVGIALGGAGLAKLTRKPALLALTGLSFVGFAGFNLIYFIGDIEVLFIPCWLMLSLWLGVGILSLAEVAGKAILRGKQPRLPEGPFIRGARQLQDNIARLLLISGTSLGLLLPGVLLVTRYAQVDQHANTIARDAWQEILAANLPTAAILLSNDRNEMMPLWYYQYVEGKRPDLLGLFPLITPDPGAADIGGLIDIAFTANRPVYLIKPMDGLTVKADLTPLPPLPHAQLVKASPINTVPSQAISLNFADTLTVTGYDLLQTATLITVTLYWQPGTTPPDYDYTTYVHLVDASGNGAAQSDHQPGGVFYPTSLWKPGQTLRDRHVLPLPLNFSPGAYTLQVGAYTQPQPGVIVPLAPAQILTKMPVSAVK